MTKLNCHIKSLNIPTNEIVYSKVEQFYFKEDHGDWYEIELSNGQKLKITGNNPVWLPKLKCYRKVSDLTGNEELLLDI